MRNHIISIVALLSAAVLLTAVLMPGCSLSHDTDNAPGEYGVYVKLERGDAASIYLHGGSFTKVCENADGSLLEAGEWLYTGDDIVQLSQSANSSVLFTVGAYDSGDTLLGEGTFLYGAAQGKLYVTISPDGVTCSTSGAPNAPVNVPPVLTLPILDEIDGAVTPGTSGSSSQAVQAAAKLLDWGVNTGLDADEVGSAASAWLSAGSDAAPERLHALKLVEEACERLLTEDARELLDSAGCENVEITWSGEMPEPVAAILQAAGLR